ncbi:MAG: pyruvate kinase [Blastopirellula sp.]|nr:MAG: pyruvate kinase [Blastopirellula sp.]
MTVQLQDAKQISIADNSIANHFHTKIVCTLGPATESRSAIESLLAQGASVFRLNFSHSNYEWATKTADLARQVAASMDRPLALLQDLCGPKIRLSHVGPQVSEIEEGQVIRLTTDQFWNGEEAENNKYDLSTNYEMLLNDVQVADQLLINDGRVALTVEEIYQDHLVAKVTRGGKVEVRKGLNLPGVALSTPSVTEKDWQDLQWGIENQVEYVALSFVRESTEILEVKQALLDANCSAQVISKIERPEAIENIDAIIEASDGIMVARGDLGLETDFARVPLLQKDLIKRCRLAAKPVITATQVLDSMVETSIPTRAEVSDVANAILDGSDAIMLSNETAVGKHPEAVVRVIRQVAEQTESSMPVWKPEEFSDNHWGNQEAVADAAAAAVLHMKAKAVVAFTESGRTARAMARYHLPVPIYAVTNNPATYRQLSLSYGIVPVFSPQIVSVVQLLEEIDEQAKQRDWAQSGDWLALVSTFHETAKQVDTLHLHCVS